MAEGQSTEDGCHKALNKFWFLVVSTGSIEPDEQRETNHRQIRSLLATCEDVTPYFNYEELGAPEGTYSVSIFAIYLDDVDLFRKYLSNGHPIDLLPNPYSGSSVMWAVFRRSHSVLSWLIRSGADVNHADSTGKTPLMIAATHDQSLENDILQLIEAGADVSAVDTEGRSALVYALWSDNQANAVYLIEKGADVKGARSYLLGELKDIRSDEHRDNVERQLAMLATITYAE